ncbi:hypothetical protein [Photorhabdus noenieputensis]|uniref:hypothetical protein n=1 Tax=Photorhabdus noenieputensis TaxID=1208607 RepID=UPI001BD5C207|nr:hypothetical protein [Photorhabdus noenieputensis]MCK3671056.1 hypothetical protein [Photorhabdus noenieputensis]
MDRGGKERIPGSIGNYVTVVSECSQQRGNLKDNGYIIGVQNYHQTGVIHVQAADWCCRYGGDGA